MGKFKPFFLERISIINYNMAIHEGNAKQRLASQCRNILLLPIEEVPERSLIEYKKLIGMIRTELSFYPKGLEITNFIGKRNSTAIKYIKILIEIEYVIRE
jgi:hypothetical protein